MLGRQENTEGSEESEDGGRQQESRLCLWNCIGIGIVRWHTEASSSSDDWSNSETEGNCGAEGQRTVGGGKTTDWGGWGWGWRAGVSVCDDDGNIGVVDADNIGVVDVDNIGVVDVDNVDVAVTEEAESAPLSSTSVPASDSPHCISEANAVSCVGVCVSAVSTEVIVTSRAEEFSESVSSCRS